MLDDAVQVAHEIPPSKIRDAIARPPWQKAGRSDLLVFVDLGWVAHGDLGLSVGDHQAPDYRHIDVQLVYSPELVLAYKEPGYSPDVFFLPLR